MNRRTFLAGAAATPLLWPARAASQPAIPIGDMHFHSYFGSSKYHSRPLAATLAAGGATLVAWSLVGDLLLVDWRTHKQKVEPRPGEALGWFERELGRIKAHCAEQRLKLVATPADVDRAAGGAPHIVLAVEGATFLETDPGRVKRAFDLGVRHLGLVHYIRNPIGDIQTLPYESHGLTDLGKQVVQECNRLGILIDVAHCAPAVIGDVLAVSTAPIVFSHGSIVRGPAAAPTARIWRARQLPLDLARAIAAKGGVVGLWALTLDIGKSVEDYARRLAEAADWLGEDHVAFGTDLNGLGPNAIVSSYAEVRGVLARWQAQGMPEPRMRKLAIGNYARVLKAAMAAQR
ncbi:MAG: membrane dipeptidase [Hyphomicrobiaceae bacterium]|nr:membrane dipeptidase [Hyphomicrobiaceae bacterium]